MPRSIHRPLRRCLGCGRIAPKAELARFTAAEDGDRCRLQRDDRSTRPGRGLYVCRARACFDRARARRAFARGARLPADGLMVDDGLGDGLEGDR